MHWGYEGLDWPRPRVNFLASRRLLKVGSPLFPKIPRHIFLFMKFPLRVHFEHDNRAISWIGINPLGNPVFHFENHYVSNVDRLQTLLKLPSNALLLVCLDHKVHVPWFLVKTYEVSGGSITFPNSCKFWHRLRTRCCSEARKRHTLDRRRKTLLCS